MPSNKKTPLAPPLNTGSCEHLKQEPYSIDDNYPVIKYMICLKCLHKWISVADIVYKER